MSKKRPMTESEDRCLTAPELAAMLNLKPDTMRIWRMRGVGPPHLKAGGAVRYLLSDVKKWMAEQRRRSTR